MADSGVAAVAAEAIALRAGTVRFAHRRGLCDHQLGWRPLDTGQRRRLWGSETLACPWSLGTGMIIWCC